MPPASLPTVAIQGEPGSFSDSAARRMVGPAAVISCESFEEVAAAVAERRVDYGVLPAENSLVGSVVDLDALLGERGLVGARELTVPIRQCLIAASPLKLADVQEVRSHPVALSQCRRFLSRHPWMRAVAVADTAGAVREMCAAGRPDLAAIAGPEAAELYGAHILADGIADRGDNATRFVLIQRRSQS
jgi:prephenate dehydratase